MWKVITTRDFEVEKNRFCIEEKKYYLFGILLRHYQSVIEETPSDYKAIGFSQQINR